MKEINSVDDLVVGKKYKINKPDEVEELPSWVEVADHPEHNMEYLEGLTIIYDNIMDAGSHLSVDGHRWMISPTWLTGVEEDTEGTPLPNGWFEDNFDYQKQLLEEGGYNPTEYETIYLNELSEGVKALKILKEDMEKLHSNLESDLEEPLVFTAVIEDDLKEDKHSHYYKDCPYDKVDVYRVLDLFTVTDPCIQHAAKKLLVTGGRGHKNIDTDVQDVIDTLLRWQEMRKEDGKVNV